MKRCVVISASCLLLWVAAASYVGAWEESEHRLLGDSAYHATMRDCAVRLGDTAYLISDGTDASTLLDAISGQHTFGQLCAIGASDDFSSLRFHERGKTIKEQLEQLTAEEIAAFLERVVTGIDEKGQVWGIPVENVACAYLLYHLAALQFAGQADALGLTPQQALMAALGWEALAQGYLADAFSSGHILVPRSGILARFQRRNDIEAHNYHRNQGVYVMNSRGDVWQTFGDKLMPWYAPTYRAVLEACQYSLNEVLVVFHSRHQYPVPEKLREWLDTVVPGVTEEEVVRYWLSGHGGEDYYVTRRMPTLLLLPMPVSATWSYRTQEVDEHGIRRRFHYPQLREEGLHDPDLEGIDQEFLYADTAMPDWLIAPPLVGTKAVRPEELVKNDADWASVRWSQNRYAPISYKGALLHLGGQVMFSDGDSRTGGMVGIGYGFWDDLVLLRNVSLSAFFLPSVFESRRSLLALEVGGGLPLGSGRLRALRIDMGVAFGLRSEYDDAGFVLGLGIDSRVWPLKITNAGITWRFKYQWFYLDELLRGPSLELILQ